MQQIPRQTIVRYTVAVAAVVIVILLKHFLIAPLIGNQQWFLLFVAAICVSSWYGGFGPGIVTAVLSALAADLFFTGSRSPADGSTLGNVFQLMLFLLEGLLVVGLTGNLRETRSVAQDNEQAKEEAMALLDMFQVYAPVGLAFLDNDLRYLRINYAMAELDGLTPAAHIGRTLQEVQPQINPELIAGIKRVVETGKPLLDQELTLTRPTLLGAKRQHLLTSYYRIRGVDGEPIGVGAVMVDMTAHKQAEEAVRESEARFRSMADTAPVMIWVADTDTSAIYFNKVWLDFTGRTLDQELGSGWLASVHPDDLQNFKQHYSTAFADHRAYETEYRLRRHDGEYRWVYDRGVPRFTPDGAYVGYIGSSIDITERKQEELAQQFVLQSGVILASSLDYQSTLANVAQLAVPTIADWCAVDLLTPSGSIERVTVAHIDPEKIKWAYELQKRFPVDMSAPTGLPRVLRTGETEFIPHIDEAMIERAATDAESYQILKDIGFTSLIIVPMNARGRTIGAITLVTTESRRHYTETDVRQAEQLAARAALAVDNSRLYGDTRTERERYRITLSSIGDAVIATDNVGHVTFMNGIAQSLTGWKENEALGQPLATIFQIVNERSRQPVENPVDHVLREGRVVGLANHTVLVSKSGVEVPIDDSGAPIPDEQGGIGGVVLVFRDMTERQRDQQRQEFLANASVALASSLDYETTLANVVNFATPSIADWCAIDLVAADGRIERLAVAHFDPEKTKWAYEMSRINPQTMAADGGLQRVIRSGKTDYVRLIPPEMLEEAANSVEEYELILSLGLKSYIIAPLTARGRTFGAFSVVAAESGRLYSEADVALVEQLAARAAMAVDNARLFSEAQAERERFRVTLSSIGDAVIATDERGGITFMNGVAQNLTGWQENEALGQPLGDIFQIINERTRQTVENPVDRVLREGQVVGLANHTVLIPKSGGEVPIDDSGAPIPNNEGGIGGVVLVFRDVTERKRQEQRQEFLAEASKVLISSLEYETTLQHVTELAVPKLADWCAVYLSKPDGTIQQVALSHNDPEGLKVRQELMQRYPMPLSRDYGYPKVIETGKSELLESVSDEILQAAASNEEHLELLRQSKYESSICVPLANLERTFGAITFNTARGGRTFNSDDLALAEELGRIASLAIENARLFRKAQGSLATDQDNH